MGMGWGVTCGSEHLRCQAGLISVYVPFDDTRLCISGSEFDFTLLYWIRCMFLGDYMIGYLFV